MYVQYIPNLKNMRVLKSKKIKTLKMRKVVLFCSTCFGCILSLKLNFKKYTMNDDLPFQEEKFPPKFLYFLTSKPGGNGQI